MSRPKYWWDGTVRKAMRLYHSTKIDNRTIQGAAMRIAIEKAIADTERMQDGIDRIRLLDLTYFRYSMNIDIAADRVHISGRTAQRWISEFVRKVGGYAGYL